MTIDWMQVLVSVVVVVGVLQWLKTFVKAPWILSIASFLLSFGVAAAIMYLPSWVRLGMLVLALGQLGYENIIQLVRRKLDSVGGPK
jgi:hypothetical protein